MATSQASDLSDERKDGYTDSNPPSTSSAGGTSRVTDLGILSNVVKLSKLGQVVAKMQQTSNKPSKQGDNVSRCVEKLREKIGTSTKLSSITKGDPDSIEWVSFIETDLEIYIKGLEMFADDTRMGILLILVTECHWIVREQGSQLPANEYTQLISPENEAFLQGFMSELLSNSRIASTDIGKKDKRSAYQKGQIAARERMISFALTEAGINQRFWKDFHLSKTFRKDDAFKGYDCVQKKMESISSNEKYSKRFSRTFDYFVKLYMKYKANEIQNRINLSAFLTDFKTVYELSARVKITHTEEKRGKTVVKSTERSIVKCRKPHHMPGVRPCEMEALKDIYDYPWKQVTFLEDEFRKRTFDWTNSNEIYSDLSKSLEACIKLCWKFHDEMFKALKARRIRSKKTGFASQVKWLNIACKNANVNKVYVDEDWAIEPLIPSEHKYITLSPQDNTVILKEFNRGIIMTAPRELEANYPSLIKFIREYLTAKAQPTVNVCWAEEVEAEFSK